MKLQLDTTEFEHQINQINEATLGVEDATEETRQWASENRRIFKSSNDVFNFLGMFISSNITKPAQYALLAQVIKLWWKVLAPYRKVLLKQLSDIDIELLDGDPTTADLIRDFGRQMHTNVHVNTDNLLLPLLKQHLPEIDKGERSFWNKFLGGFNEGTEILHELQVAAADYDQGVAQDYAPEDAWALYRDRLALVEKPYVKGLKVSFIIQRVFDVIAGTKETPYLFSEGDLQAKDKREEVFKLQPWVYDLNLDFAALIERKLESGDEVTIVELMSEIDALLSEHWATFSEKAIDIFDLQQAWIHALAQASQQSEPFFQDNFVSFEQSCSDVADDVLMSFYLQILESFELERGIKGRCALNVVILAASLHSFLRGSSRQISACPLIYSGVYAKLFRYESQISEIFLRRVAPEGPS